MAEYKFQVIQTIAIIFVAFILLKIIQKLISVAGRRFLYAKARIKVIKKVISTIYSLILILIIALVWGIAPTRLFAYVGSLLTVLGIAFLAQWSILSNITAALVIFFNHQVNIGDDIEILDKDYDVKGKVSNIGIFFILIKISTNEYVSIPSIVFMQKMVKKVKKTSLRH